jgi:hypothetical protein
VNSESLSNPANVVSGIDTSVSAVNTAYQVYKGSQGDRLDKYKKEIGEIEEAIQMNLQQKNEEYINGYSDVINRLVATIKVLLENEGDVYLKNQLSKMERDFKKIWDNRPFKGEIPKDGYESNEFLGRKNRLKEIEEDLKLVANPGGIDYRKRFHELYDEYSGLVKEVIENKEYKRILGRGEPKDVDLSKGKLTENLVVKVRRIKELWEEKDRGDGWISYGEQRRFN